MVPNLFRMLPCDRRHSREELIEATLVNISFHIFLTYTSFYIPYSTVMDWLRGKRSSATNLKAEAALLNRSTTPTPRNPDGKPNFRSGLLTIRVLWAEGLSLPDGIAVPAAIQAALASQQAKVAASVSPSSVTQQRLAHKSRGNRFVSVTPQSSPSKTHLERQR